MSDNDLNLRRLNRERLARKEAERLLEEKSSQLYEANQELSKLATNLELEVKKRTEELEEAHDKAVAANQAKSAFLANMSHEIRTPMTGIIGAAELLLDISEDTEQKRLVDVILNSSNGLLGIINDILDLSKLEAGKLEIQRESLNLDKLLDSVLDTFSVVVSKKRLCFGVEINGDVPPLIEGDPLRLRQVLLNLVGNAIKFTEKGAISISVHDGDRKLHIEVNDTGMGIDAEHHSKIFDAFGQVTQVSQKQQGTGLGLTISKRLIDAMGGNIHFSSMVGQGSTFRIDIPLIKSAEQDSQKLIRFSGSVYIFTNNKYLFRHAVSSMRRAGFNNITQVSPASPKMGKLDSQSLVMIDVDYPDSRIFENLRGLKNPPKLVQLGWVDTPGQFEHINWDAVIYRPLTRKKIEAAYYLITDQEDPVTRELTLELPAPNKYRLLLVDDNKVNLMLATAKLEKVGYIVQAFDNATDAMAALENESYDLILMDVNMPGMNGIEATQAIRQHDDEVIRNITVIALTANVMQEDIQHYLDSGMDDAIAKPIDTRQLYSTIIKWLRAKEA